jgi:hypothetical protein
MSLFTMERSRFEGEHEIRSALENGNFKVALSWPSSEKIEIEESVVFIPSVDHEKFGTKGVLCAKIANLHSIEGLDLHKDLCDQLRLVLVAYSADSGLSRVLIDVKLGDTGLLTTGEHTLEFAQMQDNLISVSPATLDPMRSQKIGFDLYVASPKITTGDIPPNLPIWQKSWTVKVQENQGRWQIKNLTPEKAADFNIPKETYIYSMLDSLSDRDLDFENAEFYLNEALFSRLEGLHMSDRVLLARHYVSELVARLSEDDLPGPEEPSLLRRLWDIFEMQTDIEDHLADDSRKLSNVGRQLLMANFDAHAALVSYTNDRISTESKSTMESEDE